MRWNGSGRRLEYMRAVAKIDDAPTGRRSIILVFDTDDAWAEVATRQEAEMAAELFGCAPASIDYDEIGQLLG